MRAPIQNIVLKEKYSTSLRFILNHLTLLVICSLFFQTLFSANGSRVDGYLDRAFQAITTARHHQEADLLIQCPIPPKGNIFLLEVDLNAKDDEDKRTTVSDFCKPFPGNLSNDEGGYNSYLNHRFLHLNSQVNNRPAIAFFILYHSWKSDLS